MAVGAETRHDFLVRGTYFKRTYYGLHEVLLFSKSILFEYYNKRGGKRLFEVIDST